MDLSHVVFDFENKPRVRAKAIWGSRNKQKYNYLYDHTRIFVRNLEQFAKTIEFMTSCINHEALHLILHKYTDRNHHWAFTYGVDHLVGWGTEYSRFSDGYAFNALPPTTSRRRKK